MAHRWAQEAAAALLAFAQDRGLSPGRDALARTLGHDPGPELSPLEEAPGDTLALLEHLERACWPERQSTQVMTPMPVARWMAQAARIGGGRLLDPAAGSGRLLLAALDVRLAQGAQAAQVVARELVGVEAEPRAACVARAVLAARCLEAGAEHLVRPCVHTGSALTLELGGFDVVLMNPPYGSADALSQEEHQVAGARWPFHRKQQDQATWFLALGAQALRPGGRLVAIAPRYWLEATGAASFRAWLTQALALEQVLDLGNVQVWPRAEVLTLLLVAHRGPPPPQVQFWRAARPQQVSALWAGQAPETYPVPTSALDAGPWVVRSPEREARVQALERGGCRAEELLAVGQGCKTGRNAVFVLKAQEAQGFREDWVVPLARGRQVRAGALGPRPEHFLLRILEQTPWGTCPRTRARLEAHREVLEARHQVRRGRARWYALSLPQNLAWMDKPKLLVPLYARRNQFTVDARGWHVLTDVYFLAPRRPLQVSLSVLALLLNSPPLEALVAARAKLKRDGYREYGGRLLRSLPLPLSQAGALVVRDPEAARAALEATPPGLEAGGVEAALQRLADCSPEEQRRPQARSHLEALVWACIGERP